MLGSCASTYVQICRQVLRSGQLKHISSILQSSGVKRCIRGTWRRLELSIRETGPVTRPNRALLCSASSIQKKYHSTSLLSIKPEINKDLGELRRRVSRSARRRVQLSCQYVFVIDRRRYQTGRRDSIPGSDPAAAAASQRFRYSQSGSCRGLNDECRMNVE